MLLDPPPPPRPAFKVYRRHCQVSHSAKNGAAIKEKELLPKIEHQGLGKEIQDLCIEFGQSLHNIRTQKFID